MQGNCINPLRKRHGLPLNISYNKTSPKKNTNLCSLFQITIHTHRQLLPIRSQTYLHLTPASSPPHRHLQPLRVVFSELPLVDCVSEQPLDLITVGMVQSYKHFRIYPLLYPERRSCEHLHGSICGS